MESYAPIWRANLKESFASIPDPPAKSFQQQAQDQSSLTYLHRQVEGLEMASDQSASERGSVENALDVVGMSVFCRRGK